MTRYVVAHWCPGRGQTKEDPAEYIGAYGYLIKSLKEVDFQRCYKSEKMALREASKLYSRYWRASVVEVSGSMEGGTI